MAGHTESKMPGNGTTKVTQIPEWEDAAVKGDKASAPGMKMAFSSLIDRVMPSYKCYLGMKRTPFLLLLLGVVLACLAVIIGLVVGLSHRNKDRSNIFLPPNTQTFTGDLTYYSVGLGACGETDTDSDDIVAVSHLLFDAAGSSSSDGGNSNQNPLCGKMLRAFRHDGEVGAERSVDLKVVDRCTGCKVDDLDTSITAFEKVAPKASGRVEITWAWLQPVQT